MRLTRHFHEHPHGRLHEFAFWAILGVITGALALWGWRAGWMSTPISLVLAVISICLIGWGMLPHPQGPKKPAAEPGRKSKRR